VAPLGSNFRVGADMASAEREPLTGSGLPGLGVNPTAPSGGPGADLLVMESGVEAPFCSLFSILQNLL